MTEDIEEVSFNTYEEGDSLIAQVKLKNDGKTFGREVEYPKGCEFDFALHGIEAVLNEFLKNQ